MDEEGEPEPRRWHQERRALIGGMSVRLLRRKVGIIDSSEEKGRLSSCHLVCTFRNGDRVIIHLGTVTLIELLRS